jgi:hypothetical protein
VHARCKVLRAASHLGVGLEERCVEHVERECARFGATALKRRERGREQVTHCAEIRPLEIRGPLTLFLTLQKGVISGKKTQRLVKRQHLPSLWVGAGVGLVPIGACCSAKLREERPIPPSIVLVSVGAQALNELLVAKKKTRHCNPPLRPQS